MIGFTRRPAKNPRNRAIWRTGQRIKKMNRFCLIFTTLDAECQCIKNTAPAIQGLVQKLIHSCSQAEEKCRDFMFPDLEYSLNDPIFSLANGRPEISLSMIEEIRVFPHLTKFPAKWYTGESLKELPNLLEIPNTTGKLRSSETSDDNISEKLHKLADSLPAEAGVPVEIFWFTCGRNNLPIRSHLGLFGALKRLQQWCNARINVLCSEEVDKNSYLKSWQRSLDMSIIQLNNIKADSLFNPHVVWHGALVLSVGKIKVNLPGFVLSCESSKPSSEFNEYASLCDKRKAAPVHQIKKQDTLIAPEITMHCKIERCSVPFHIFLPIKLKLDLKSSSSKASARFVEWLCAECNQNVAVVGSILLVIPTKECSKSRNKDSWVNFVMCQRNSENSSLESGKEEHWSRDRRLCLITAGTANQLNLFVLRSSEQFNCKIQNDLAFVHSTCQISRDQEVGGPLVFPDITDTFWETEEYFRKRQLDSLQQEISKSANASLSTNCLNELASEMYEQKWTYLKALREKLRQSGNTQQLKVVKRNVLLEHSSSDLLPSPSKWPERLWLMRSDPKARMESCVEDVAKENIPFLVTASSVNIKDILDKFRPDGTPVRNDLGPILPRQKDASDRYIQVNSSKDLADIRRERYPEVLDTSYHGIEYCRDDHRSLAKDSNLALLQSSLLKYETLSLYVEKEHRQTLSRCTRAVTKAKHSVGKDSLKPNTVTKAAKTVSVIEKRQASSERPLKRKSPGATTMSAVLKRKRQTSVEEADTRQTNDNKKETRSERHKRRLRQVVQKTLEDNGIGTHHAFYERCTERLYSLCKSFLKDLQSSHGLNDEMKRLANSNVQQVIEFETKRGKREERT